MQVVNRHTSELLQQTTVIFRLLRQKKEYAFIARKAEAAYTELSACYGPSDARLKRIESITDYFQFQRFINETEQSDIFTQDYTTSQGSHEVAVLVIAFCRTMANHMIRIYGELESELEFWRDNLQTHPLVLFLQKTPLYWIRKIHKRFSGSTPQKTVTEEEQDKLRGIRRVMSYVASVVGALVRTIDSIANSAASSDVAVDELLDVFENELFHLFDVRFDKTTTTTTTKTDSDDIEPEIIRRNRLNNIFSNSNKIRRASRHKLFKYRPAGSLSRWWLLFGAGTAMTGFGVWYLSRNWDWALKQSKENILSIKRFIGEHIVDPIWNIYSVIRYDEAKHRLVDPVSINVSEQSLEKMVTDLVLDREPNVNDITLSNIKRQVQGGNLSVVMERYTNAIRRPIYEALFGDLARLILIQVQKQKVDIDRTMQSMDKLMKANELNFELMAMIPGILTLVFATYQIFFFRRHQESMLHTKLRIMLLESERILNRNLNGPLDIQSQGQITILGANMTRIATELRNHRMLEDINEIVSEEMSVNQRLQSAQRMFRDYFIPSTIYKN